MYRKMKKNLKFVDYDKLDMITKLVNFFTATSTTVNFMALGTGLLDTIFSSLGVSEVKEEIDEHRANVNGQNQTRNSAHSGKTDSGMAPSTVDSHLSDDFDADDFPDAKIFSSPEHQNYEDNNNQTNDNTNPPLQTNQTYTPPKNYFSSFIGDSSMSRKITRYIIGYTVFTLVFILSILNVRGFEKILEKYTSVLVNTISGPVIAVLYYKVFGSCLQAAWNTGHYGEFFHELLRMYLLFVIFW